MKHDISSYHDGGLRVAFLHPDLGLGGAERLVIDAAAELVRHGHHVDLYTAYYDPQRCFEETKAAIGGFSVTVAGGWFPRSILGRMIALCAYVRCMLAALYIVWVSWTHPSTTGRKGSQPCYDVIVVDQVSAAIPVLRLTSSKVLFYCHFPDMLLSLGREASLVKVGSWVLSYCHFPGMLMYLEQEVSMVKRLYRAPLDWLEESTTGMSDLILVNSSFTRGMFKKTFARLATAGIEPEVLHPAVPVPSEQLLSEAESCWASELDPALSKFIQPPMEAEASEGGASSSCAITPPLFLSINRFERKKGIGLAVQALANLLGILSSLHEQQRGRGAGGVQLLPRLVIAGGYDARLAENREHLEELKEQVQELGLQGQVFFLPSFTDRQRTLLLAACTAVLYTPQNEHFGIVPLEAMAAGRPVVACNSGGPLESVADGSTGLLCKPDADDWAAAMGKLLAPDVARSMGQAARKHVVASHSRKAFGNRLDAYVRQLAEKTAATHTAKRKAN